MASASGGQQFMALKPLRDGSVVRGGKGLRSGATALRSDQAALSNGFMRMDRARLKPVHRYRNSPAAITTRAPAPSPSDGADESISALFDNAMPASNSFRDTLKGNANRVRHAWPVPANVSQYVSSGYGMRTDPFHGRKAFHGGIDIAAASGTPVIASAEGTVRAVTHSKGLGNYVVVSHRDGTESYYGHLSRHSVRAGQHVRQGQQVGELGSTGRSTGPHLDYRIKKNGETFNPMTVLNAPNNRVASR